MCISAYLKAARVLKLDGARRFALRSLDRILSQGWDAKSGLQHVIAYSDPQAAKRHVPGVLDDYAFTAIACLDAYEASADLSYFHFAEKIAAAMIARFHDPREGGFFDMATRAGGRRWAGAGRAGRAAQAFAGFTDSGRQSRGRDCAAATACLHQ